MKRKVTFIVVIMVLMAGIVNAQTENDGFKKLDQKQYSAAKQIFSELLKADSKDPVALYGMGEYYFSTGKMDSAKIFYQNGIDAKSSYEYNYAGLGKVSLASNPAAAEGYFKDAIKKSRKDVGAIVSIAKFYYEKTPKNLAEAKRYVTMAIEGDAKNAAAFFLNGLINLEQANTSEAAINFDRSIYFDPTNLEAYLYASNIMVTTRNTPQAIGYLTKALEINPKYWPAYKGLGEVHYGNQNYVEAIKNFEIYYKNITPPDNDVTHYAYSLFFNKQYDQAREMIDKLLQKNPNDYVLLRLVGYISYETKDMVTGREVMDKLFKITPPDKLLPDDYSYYGKMLSEAGNDSLAIETYKLALKKDSTQYQIYDDISKSYNKLQQYEEGLKYSSKYFEKKPNLSAADYYYLGKAYYSMASSLTAKKDSLDTPVDPLQLEADSLKQLEYCNEADSLFAKVEELAPTSYLGTFWRARVSAIIDKDVTLGLAKPYYEKALEILILDSVKYKKEISEVYSYLGFYYYVKGDNTNSLDYWRKLLALDPENAVAQNAINSLEKKK